jgi:hypothetical protein
VVEGPQLAAREVPLGCLGLYLPLREELNGDKGYLELLILLRVLGIELLTFFDEVILS